MTNHLQIIRNNRAKDQDLRPWTLDNTFDASIQNECDELDQALERTSPFKKGGDFQYYKMLQDEDSKSNINTTKMPVIKRVDSSQSSKRPKSQRAITPLVAFIKDESEEKEVCTEMIADTTYTNSSHLVKKFVLSPSIIHKKIELGIKQTNVYGNSRRKAPMRNIIHRPQQKYQNFIKKQQAEIESNERPSTAESYFEKDDTFNEGFIPIISPSKLSPSSSPKNTNLESLLSDIEYIGFSGPESDDYKGDSGLSTTDGDIDINHNDSRITSRCNDEVMDMKRYLRPTTSNGISRPHTSSRPNTAPAQINLNIQSENDGNGILNMDIRRRSPSALPRMITTPTLKGIKYEADSTYGSSYVRQEREEEERHEKLENEKNERNQILGTGSRGSPGSLGTGSRIVSLDNLLSDGNLGKSATLCKRRIKEEKSLKETALTTAGALSIHAHPNADQASKDEVIEEAITTKLMTQNVKDLHEVDNVWELMKTPGHIEHVGPNNIYKSEMNSSHSCNDKFQESVKNMNRSYNVKVDGLKKWTEKAAMSNTKLFTSGGTMNFK
eukprot:CAMPEP_0119051822 /NCGR_PEP_ID=MMETSP1177-20130426/73311_1 /TAXON_ID=2985 /ORGANISM="Ochromonas sp, Strain CCMP1899" /LENGTH=553 /DNA_ID=CAMNT_0007031155 /DNA_START=182 /DNA_END=1843 /DNA_ORIENTATION=+